MRALAPLIPVLWLLGCANVEGKLEDVTWGNSFEADYAETIARAKQATLRHFDKGLDPDKTNEEAGDLWTIWHYEKSMWYRKTLRKKAHVKVERAGEGKVRVGVAVVQQINENIDNPDSIEDARWVNTVHDPKVAGLIEEAIARRYLKVEPSEYWKQEHSEPEKKKGLRKDLVDRARDVDLGDPDPKKDTEEFPKLDNRVRAAVTVARRLQDPLAELVKVRPSAISVGTRWSTMDSSTSR